MIRPLTIATCLLACGSGLYLYQSKHQVELLDRTIERTVHDTTALREQSRLLAAEWTMLNDPERLQQFSDTYLNLKPIAPPQFTSLADLDSRLPAAQPEPPSSHGSDEPDPAPVVSENSPPGRVGFNPDLRRRGRRETTSCRFLPFPPRLRRRPLRRLGRQIPGPRIARQSLARSPRTVSSIPSWSPTPAQSDQRPSDQRPSDQRPSDQHAVRATRALHASRTLV